MGKDGGVFVSEGALTVPGDEGHGLKVFLARWEMRKINPI
jgi:hypothetical protein